MSERQANIANQREVALIFRKNYPAVEKIRFTQDGGNPGLGASWRVNAAVTFEGMEYHQILSFRFMGGDPLPDVEPKSPSIPTLVVFSDGTSEEID